jgi:hypothetical protein
MSIQDFLEGVHTGINNIKMCDTQMIGKRR